MANLIDYLKWRGDLSFDQDGFNELDAAILALYSYLPIGETVPARLRRNKATIAQTCDNTDTGVPLLDLGEFAKVLKNSRRFADIKVSKFVNVIDDTKAEQFSAVTCTIKKGLICVAFRGTDSTITGWRENLNLSYETQVPAQRDAVRYLNETGKYTSGKIIVCGHSKGGNLAVYASAFCDGSIRKRIEAVYNYDGPGFNREVIAKENFVEIADKVHTFVPQSSLVGVLLHHAEKIKIVRSASVGGVNQHVPLSWKVDPTSFVCVDEMSPVGEKNRTILREWLDRMSFEEREEFAKNISNVLEDGNIRTVNDFADIKNIISAAKAYKQLDDDQKKSIADVIDELRDTITDGIRSSIADGFVSNVNAAKEFIKQKTPQIGHNSASKNIDN